MLWLYRLIFLPGLALSAPYYLWRMRRRGGYGENFRQRFGEHHAPRRRPGVRRIWLQAVSVGEMLAIGPLLEGLHRAGVEVYLTTTTSTGYKMAGERYRRLTLGIGYFPIDWAPFSARAWRGIDPDLALLTEGERWPEHLAQARRRRVPVLAINGRISDRSYARMMLFPPAAHLMVGGLARVLPASAQDAERFAALGVPADRIAPPGNIKLDVEIPLLDEAARARLRHELGLPEGLVLLGSSTWPGEEEAVLEAWRRARSAGLQVSLLLVPRHAERRGEIEARLRGGGLRIHFRSRGAALSAADVAVGDTTGELRQFTQLADLVFVGKSLPPHTEGQTPVEAAALGRAILLGPGMGNFRQIADELLERGAARAVRDPAELAEQASELLRDGTRRAAMAEAAAAWRRENAGALARTLAAVEAALAAAPRIQG
ncbi:MAG TPA: glycosyltransferase N-terminal domain-containing protein [Opitutaceae bacterium]|nr:glycosyltransferase N-terminal domain-containing protein [Opitutaceae bacterium]